VLEGARRLLVRRDVEETLKERRQMKGVEGTTSNGRRRKRRREKDVLTTCSAIWRRMVAEAGEHLENEHGTTLERTNC
jgi:hypothetical protein